MVIKSPKIPRRSGLELTRAQSQEWGAGTPVDGHAPFCKGYQRMVPDPVAMPTAALGPSFPPIHIVKLIPTHLQPLLLPISGQHVL